MITSPNQLRWYAVYTAPRAEKKVSERFSESGIDHYLALRKVKRQWTDRIKDVMIPVISGYIFVRILPTDFLKVTGIYGAIAFVREGGAPCSIPENQIESLKFMVEKADEPVEYSAEPIERGEIITITKGPLEGMMGELMEIKGKYKVLVRLERLGCATTEVPLSYIAKVSVVGSIPDREYHSKNLNETGSN